MNFDSINFFSSPETTKDMIIQILAEEFPISLMKIKNQLQKRFQKNISYQGIYKELNSMIEKRILIKIGKEYQLNEEWILNINKFSQNTYANYTNQIIHTINDIISLKNEGDTKTLVFSNHYEIDKFFIDLLQVYNDFFDEDMPILMHYKNNTWPFLYTSQEFEIMNKLKSKFYTLCIPESEVDKWACEFEQKIGLKVKIVPEKTPFWMFHLFGPYVINYIVDEKIFTKLKIFFKENSSIKKIDLKKLLKIIHEKGEFKVVFMKNSQIRESLINEIKSNFS